MKPDFSGCHPDILQYIAARSLETPPAPRLQHLPHFPKQRIFSMLDLCSSTCLALTCKDFYSIYRLPSLHLVRLDHVTVLKTEKRPGQQEFTYITLHYLLRRFMEPYWKWDADHGIFRPKDKVGTAMLDDEFQEWVNLNRSKGRDRGCGWKGMGGKVVVRNGRNSEGIGMKGYDKNIKQKYIYSTFDIY